MEKQRAGTLAYYSKPDCPLCDKAWPIAVAIARRHAMELVRVDIESDPELLASHHDRIPVLELDGETLGWGLLSERAIERKLARDPR